jgi:hypothetical protein
MSLLVEIVQANPGISRKKYFETSKLVFGVGVVGSRFGTPSMRPDLLSHRFLPIPADWLAIQMPHVQARYHHFISTLHRE